MQRLDVLLRRLHAGEGIAQIDLHRFPLVRRSEELDFLKLALNRCEEGKQLLFRRRRGFIRLSKWQLAGAGKFEPFVGDDDDGLRQIERGESRIDRKRQDGVGKRHFIVLKAVAFAPE